MNTVAQGMACFWRGMRMIGQPALRWFVIIPVVINLVIFVAFFYWLGARFDAWVTWMLSGLPDWLSFLKWLLWLFYGGFILLVFVYAFVTVANMIGSPFYGYLSELVQKNLTGKTINTSGSWKAILRSVPAAVGRELRKMLYYLPRALMILVLGFIPVVNVIAAILWLVFSAWMMAMQYVDYASDNNGQSFSEMRRRLGNERWKALGFGSLVLIGTMIPLVNLVVVPAAVCGATVMWVESQNLSRDTN